VDHYRSFPHLYSAKIDEFLKTCTPARVWVTIPWLVFWPTRQLKDLLKEPIDFVFWSPIWCFETDAARLNRENLSCCFRSSSTPEDSCYRVLLPPQESVLSSQHNLFYVEVALMWVSSTLIQATVCGGWTYMLYCLFFLGELYAYSLTSMCKLYVKHRCLAKYRC
jgi:hypothetical protein